MINSNLSLLDSVRSGLLTSKTSELAPFGVGCLPGRCSSEGYMQTPQYILSQLVDSEELSTLSPEELRAMLAELDDEVVNGGDDEDETVTVDSGEVGSEK